MIHCLIIADVQLAERMEAYFYSHIDEGRNTIFCIHGESSDESVQILRKHGSQFDVIICDVDGNDKNLNRIIDQARNIHHIFPRLFFLLFTNRPYVRTLNLFLPYISIYQKPFAASELREIFESYYEIFEYTMPQYRGKIRLDASDGIRILDARSILYLKRNGQGTHVMTPNGSLLCRNRMEQILEDTDLEFCRCGYSCAVNGLYIERVTAKQICLRTGDVLSISRSYKSLVNEYMKKYEY